jgi:hypothetical protein
MTREEAKLGDNMMITEEVVYFCRKELNIPDDILISVEYADLSEDSVLGWAVDSAEDGEYDIEIERTLGFKDVVRTVCHEMVHVQQMVEGRDLDEAEAYEKEELLARRYF